MRIEVAYALPSAQTVVLLDLDAAATVADALAAVAAQAPFSELDLDSVAVGIYGTLVSRDQGLQEHDRVEIYRPLQVDPKEARRQRAR